MERVLFREEQKFSQWWYRLLILIIIASTVIPFSIGIYTQFVVGKPWGDNPMSDTGLILSSVLVFSIVIVISWLLMKLKLVTEIRSEGLWFRFPPLIRKWKIIRKEEIERYEIRRYKPIREYGGYGIRQGIGKAGIAYNVYGKVGLQLYLLNGKKILIGTQKQQSLKSAMDKMKEK